MIYVLFFTAKWLLFALLPALMVGAAGAILAWGLRRSRVVVSRPYWLGVLIVASATLGWQSRTIVREFLHPEVVMFERYVADPVPADVRYLTIINDRAAYFAEGVSLQFQAPPSLLRAIVADSLPGSNSRRVIEGLKSLGRADTLTTTRISAPDGRGYAAIDPASLPAGLDSAFSDLRKTIVDALALGAEVHLLAESGPWGRFAAMVTYDRASETVEIRQLVAQGPAAK